MNENSVYVILNDSNFQKEVLESTRPVLVEFCADWCGGCHLIAPMIEELAHQFNRQLRFCKMDTDKNKKMAKEYGIRELPTLLFFKNGRVVDHIIKAVPREVVAAKVKALLKTE